MNNWSKPSQGELSHLTQNDFREKEAKACLFNYRSHKIILQGMRCLPPCFLHKRHTIIYYFIICLQSSSLLPYPTPKIPVLHSLLPCVNACCCRFIDWFLCLMPDLACFCRGRSRAQERDKEPLQERFFRPHFLQAPGDMVAHEGRLCRLDCKVDSNPPPWFQICSHFAFV